MGFALSFAVIVILSIYGCYLFYFMYNSAESTKLDSFIHYNNKGDKFNIIKIDDYNFMPFFQPYFLNGNDQ